MIELTPEEIKHETVELLKKLDTICEDNGFTYFLMMGTLLGAIRHNGFIPWDDDLDIMMPRDDFDNFLKYCNDHQNELFPLKLCTRKNTENYTYGIPRFCDMRFKYITTSTAEKPIDLGIFIDIYPLDNYGNSDKEIERIRSKMNRINSEYYIYINPVSQNSIVKTILRYGVKFYYLIKKQIGPYKDVDKHIKDTLFKMTANTDRFVGNPIWTDRHVGYNRKDFESIIKHEFEGCMFPVPSGYDRILRTCYGDYMSLPPENQRVPYHHYKIYKR